MTRENLNNFVSKNYKTLLSLFNILNKQYNGALNRTGKSISPKMCYYQTPNSQLPVKMRVFIQMYNEALEELFELLNAHYTLTLETEKQTKTPKEYFEEFFEEQSTVLFDPNASWTITAVSADDKEETTIHLSSLKSTN